MIFVLRTIVIGIHDGNHVMGQNNNARNYEILEEGYDP